MFSFGKDLNLFSVFVPTYLQRKKKNVNPFPIPCFHDPKINYTENEVGKEEIDCNEFSFSHNVFLPSRSMIFFSLYNAHLEMSATPSNVDMSKILSFVKGLNEAQNEGFSYYEKECWNFRSAFRIIFQPTIQQ